MFMKVAMLPDRGVVKVAGDEARRFLNGIITNDVENLAPASARFAALLTPQGKIIVDFIVTEAPEEDGGGFFLDCPRALSPTLAERLSFYKLRSKVTIDDLSERVGVIAIWEGNGGTSDAALLYPDPRLPALGRRGILPLGQAGEAAGDLGGSLVDEAVYDAHRIALGVPRGGLDFMYNGAFPHETAMDQLHGVDFRKGCYIGQEVVSRMQHRGSARTRVVGVTYDGGAPEAGTPLTAGEKVVGTMGTARNGRGIATLRLDRLEDAQEAGTPLMGGGVELRAFKPDWADFSFPGDTVPAA
jgi:folate-binding protein YgfZ